ncbi:MAG: glycine--tRNA ligase subunit beta [Alphaproteobacteria bacterium]
MAELLLELFSEEIPARMQQAAVEQLKRVMGQKLAAAGLQAARVIAFVTPRRLALMADGLPSHQPDAREEKRGPRVGAPETAVQGFLKSVGLVSLDQCEVRDTGKGEFYFAVVERKGRPAPDVIAEIVTDTVRSFDWPKSMRWGGRRLSWVRPLQRIMCIFDARAVPLDFGKDDIPCGNVTSGHRFLAPQPVAVLDFAEYCERLRASFVVLDHEERRETIRADSDQLVRPEGLTVKPDEALLSEVAGLVEWPVVLLGSIDPAFMDLPAEVLTTAMRSHQKYFALLDGDGRLAPKFVMVANMLTDDGGAAIVKGNERVLRARLQDAKFFWDQDRKHPLESRVPRLAEIVFHAKLGTLADKVTRIEALAAELAPLIPGADVDMVRSAATLAKADLVTGMVGEFPELQGVIGRYYALAEGEKEEVADAIRDHYAPLGPNDRCPCQPVSIAVALADKIDTLTGFFAINERPTGSKDPFALRRAALGVIRLILENSLRLPLVPVIGKAMALQKADVQSAAKGEAGSAGFTSDLLDFFADRLKVHLREKGVRHDLIAAIFALKDEDDLVRLLARVDALGAFLATEDGGNLLTAYKRASNIVRIEEKKDNATYDGPVDESLLREDDERAVFERLEEVRGLYAPAFQQERFDVAMMALARLRRPVDAFFDHVTVNCDDRSLRANRLRLLSAIRKTMEDVADFSRIEGGTEKS